MNFREGGKRVGLALVALYWIAATAVCALNANDHQEYVRHFPVVVSGVSFDVEAFDKPQAVKFATEAQAQGHYAPGGIIVLQANSFSRAASLPLKVMNFVQCMGVALAIFAPLFLLWTLASWVIRGFAATPS